MAEESCKCQPKDNIERTYAWIETALPAPDAMSCDIQFGCKFEEEAEILYALLTLLEKKQSPQLPFFRDAFFALKAVSDILRGEKAEPIIGLIEDKDVRIELLDGLVDSTVTNVSISRTQGFNISGAYSEINDSNYSKFENGKPVYYDDGKVRKGKDYRPPNLAPFI